MPIPISRRPAGLTLRACRLATYAVAAAIACLALPAQASAATVTRATADSFPEGAAVDRYVQSEIAAQHIPGLALSIVHAGRIVHMRGFGEADSSGREVTPRTPFMVGSITKSVTALAIMQLVEAGRLDLDAPTQRYLPWWRLADPAASAQITVRHLLYQVSGLSKATGNAYATSEDTGDSALENRVRTLRSADLTSPAGTTWQYSNANYWTLGMIVQAVSGQPYEAYVQQHIYDPLQMSRSFTCQTEAERHGLPIGHRYWYGFPVAAQLPCDRGAVAAGGLTSTAEDMAHYVSIYLNRGRYAATPLVSPAAAAQLQHAAVPTGLHDVSYAMGWEVSHRNGALTVSHDGSEFNAHADVILLPEHGWGVVLMENAENSPDEFFGSRRMTGIANGVADILLGRPAAATSTSASLWAAYAAVLGIVVIQIGGMAWSLRTLRRWRTTPRSTPSGALKVALHLGFPLLVSWIWVLTVLAFLPRTIRAPLSALLTGLPDLGFPLVVSAVVALVWGLTRTGWAISILRGRPQQETSDHIYEAALTPPGAFGGS